MVNYSTIPQLQSYYLLFVDRIPFDKKFINLNFHPDKLPIEIKQAIKNNPRLTQYVNNVYSELRTMSQITSEKSLKKVLVENSNTKNNSNKFNIKNNVNKYYNTNYNNNSNGLNSNIRTKIDRLLETIRNENFSQLKQFANNRISLILYQHSDYINGYSREEQSEIIDCILNVRPLKNMQIVIEKLDISLSEINNILAFALFDLQKSKLNREYIEYYFQKGAIISEVEKIMSSQAEDDYLMGAICYVYDPEILQLLIDRGANYNLLADYINGKYISFAKVSNDNFIKCVKILIDAGADLNKPITYNIFKGETALMASLEFPEMFDILLDKGADVSPVVDGMNLHQYVMKKILSLASQEKTDARIQKLVDLSRIFKKLQSLSKIDIPLILSPFKTINLKDWGKSWLKNELNVDVQSNLRSNIITGGGKEYFLFNKRKYLVNYGPRGGKFITVKSEKIRIK